MLNKAHFFLLRSYLHTLLSTSKCISFFASCAALTIQNFRKLLKKTSLLLLFPRFSLIPIQLFFTQILFADTEPHKCVQIYYDKVPSSNPKNYDGRIYATFLQNLLGHFPNIQQYVIPIESYKSGQLDRCAASIYIGSYYDNKIPQAFLDDFVKTKKNVVWIGYNIWKLKPAQVEGLWGVEFLKTATLDLEHLDAEGNPGFYKFQDYKGEVFEKIWKFSTNEEKKIDTAADINLFTLSKPEAKSNVVAWTRHSTQLDQRTPYILQNKNHWHIADNPFSWMGIDDRYLIFADILFDIVQEPPLYPDKKPALVRLEDVNIGSTTPAQIQAMSDMFYKLKAPFVVSLIPIFADPFMVIVKNSDQKRQTILNSSDFIKSLLYAKQKGGNFIMHGVTHQSDGTKNPFNGVSGSDFEFWDKVNEMPIKEDSVSYILDRLAEGVEIMEKAGLPPMAWMPPHYLASPLDFVIFGQVFTWNIGRVGYWLHQISQAKPLPETLTFDRAGAKGNKVRLAYFSDLFVKYPKKMVSTSQLFPYEIYGDSYGQRLIPENVGNIQTYLSNQVVATRTVDDMIKTIKRNRVLRDVWASFFIHPFLLNTSQNWGIARYPGDTEELERLIKETQAAGYEFINLQEWIKKNTKPKTLPVIEIDPPEYTQ